MHQFNPNKFRSVWLKKMSKRLYTSKGVIEANHLFFKLIYLLFSECVQFLGKYWWPVRDTLSDQCNLSVQYQTQTKHLWRIGFTFLFNPRMNNCRMNQISSIISSMPSSEQVTGTTITAERLRTTGESFRCSLSLLHQSSSAPKEINGSDLLPATHQSFSAKSDCGLTRRRDGLTKPAEPR
jgi:hypothetical protein